MSEVSWWWSWLLMVVGVTGMWLAGKRLWWAWLVGVFSELLWIVYAVVSNQPGFIVFALVYAWVYAKNAYDWRREDVITG